MSNLTETIQNLTDMAQAMAEAKEVSTPTRAVYALGHKMIKQTDVTLPTDLADALNAFLAGEVSLLPNRADGNALVEQLGNAIIGVNAGLPAPKGFTVDGAQKAIDAWKAVAGKGTGSTGTSTPDAPGRVVIDFTYPGGVDSVSPVGREGKYTTHVDQAAMRSNILWEITKRGKALSGVAEDARNAFKMDDESREGWRTFWNENVKANVEGSTTLAVNVGSGEVMYVDITYKA